eukprot:4848860-Amphidinium_carterae.1
MVAVCGHAAEARFGPVLKVLGSNQHERDPTDKAIARCVHVTHVRGAGSVESRALCMSTMV